MTVPEGSPRKRNEGSIEALLRTVASMGERFSDAVELLHDKSDARMIGGEDRQLLREVVGRLRDRAREVGYVGKGEQ